MDDLTRLFLAARDADRTALFHAVQETQADVWRLAAHLVGRDDADADALIAGLDRDRRAAFVLTQVVGCSYAEAVSICSVPVGTIRSRVARARERLLVQLREADTA